MNKRALAAVALLSEADAAKVFNMGTTRFKARCAARPSRLHFLFYHQPRRKPTNEWA